MEKDNEIMRELKGRARYNGKYEVSSHSNVLLLSTTRHTHFFSFALDFIVSSCETISFRRKPWAKLFRYQRKRSGVLLPGNLY